MEGGSYEGELKEDMRHGKGNNLVNNITILKFYFIFTDPFFETSYFYYLILFKGKFCFSDGDIYEGEWKDDKRSG